MAKNKLIKVKGKEITLFSTKVDDYISLTDMARYRDAERTNYIIQNWMRTRSAIEFCGLWEQLNNPNFKSIEFDAFKNQSGANSFALTSQKWIESTNAKCQCHAHSSGNGTTGTIGTAQSNGYHTNNLPAKAQRPDEKIEYLNPNTGQL
ncbi:KilA-N domain-containing protein [Cyclobacterium sp.]|uniref:KilA-N domain-containing protein n=1 Tax=Cyclobacterium sp. TaxID=1966343 RepID=UPI0019955488|nr:KilA-N domain-containing protein [Cyclobacterium sp.]MBD3626890.1 KilA-N domain-containing protein [Cyclobacterium sp.]